MSFVFVLIAAKLFNIFQISCTVLLTTISYHYLAKMYIIEDFVGIHTPRKLIGSFIVHFSGCENSERSKSFKKVDIGVRLFTLQGVKT